ncbi:protein-L-isoaspartate O-methyltransferase family protein [Propylenella binzhouense]|uniref:Protein-L-isoaspartate O-methyltransferase n=1 Tax=Propylenella binzhouense TaxID=2555902 RepID=A0A964WT64_9HYPH|nr:protein-L-isoaspartate O-methyltransferase [Propylenella binzhouense]MYZ47707.1 protein-L-isoaspartate O-methyltransferase [Propylenella binzhouense]
MTDFALLRQRMVENQIRPSEITDRRLIAAFLATPREIFVPPSQKPFAYADKDLPVASGPEGDRAMMAPVQLARLVQALDAGESDVALVVGCMTGYSAAILARLAASVVAVDEDEVLVRTAEERLRDLAIDNAAVLRGKLTEGYPDEGPYDVILMDGAVEVRPEGILAQLGKGGRLAVVERADRISRAVLYERTRHDEIGRRPLFEAWVPMLPGFRRKPSFVF